MEIRETLFSKSIEVETDDSYIVSIDFMRRISDAYFVYERKNVYETDGPEKRSAVIFDVIEKLDEFSQVVVNFTMEGDNNQLYVTVKGEFVIRVKDKGFFSEVFTEFYLNNILPPLQKLSKVKMKELEAEIQNI